MWILLLYLYLPFCQLSLYIYIYIFFFLLLSIMFPPLCPNNTTENQLWFSILPEEISPPLNFVFLDHYEDNSFFFLKFWKAFFIIIIFNFVSLNFFLISWRLITLQYCSGFCHTLTWISLGYTCIPHNSFTWFISFSREEVILYVSNISLNLCFFPLNDQNPK